MPAPAALAAKTFLKSAVQGNKPMFLNVIRMIARTILHLIARVDVTGYENIPETGGAIVAANHLGRLDAMLAVILSERKDFILLIADKYENSLVWGWLGRKLDAIWINRSDVDFRALRDVFKRLKQGEILGIAPEGTRSKSEALAQGKLGTAYLAAKTGVPVIPVAVWGTEDRVVSARLKRLKRLDITIRIGEPFFVPALDRGNRDASLTAGTELIMCHIARLLPPQYHGYYADHPCLQEPEVAADPAVAP